MADTGCRLADGLPHRIWENKVGRHPKSNVFNALIKIPHPASCVLNLASGMKSTNELRMKEANDFIRNSSFLIRHLVYKGLAGKLEMVDRAVACQIHVLPGHGQTDQNGGGHIVMHRTALK